MVYPTILGVGKRLYPAGAKSILALMESRQFGGGIVLLRYKPACRKRAAIRGGSFPR